MNNIENIFFTASLTLVGGVILLVMTEILKTMLIAPIQKTREQIQVVLSKVDLHCNMLTNFFSKNPDDDEKMVIKSIRRDLRESATNLKSNYTMLSLKNLLSWMKILPSQDHVDVAYSSLIYLHNSILTKADATTLLI